MTVIFSTHKIDEVLEIATRVLVMKDGNFIEDLMIEDFEESL